MMPEWFALEDIAEMDLDYGKGQRMQRVEDRDRGMGISTCIDDKA